MFGILGDVLGCFEILRDSSRFLRKFWDSLRILEDSLTFLEDSLRILEDSLTFLEDSLRILVDSLTFLEDSCGFFDIP